MGLCHFQVLIPNKAELEKVVNRIQQAGVTMQQTEEGILVRDPSQNSVLLSAR